MSTVVQDRGEQFIVRDVVDKQNDVARITDTETEQQQHDDMVTTEQPEVLSKNRMYMGGNNQQWNATKATEKKNKIFNRLKGMFGGEAKTIYKV